MLKVALISQKGGAGKSTLALHLATEAGVRGLGAAAIDLDPQGNLTRWASRRGDLPPDVYSEHPAALENGLSAAGGAGKYGIVFMDTAPHADRGALTAAKSADLILIPCRPATFDLEAIETTLDLCQLAKRPAVVVLNAAPTRSRVVQEAIRVIVGRGGTVSPVVIHQRVAFQHCLIEGRTAAEFEPDGGAARELAALYDDMMARLNGGVPTLQQ
jgi:chromosome partitioning protein